MKPSNGESFFQQIKAKLKVGKKRGYRKTKLSQTVIRACERSIGFKFPISYLEFLHLIGPGQFNDYFFIDAPDEGSRRNYGIASRVREERGNAVLAEVYESPTVINRMIPFGDTISGDIFFWDPDECTIQSKSEFMIYVLPRYSDQIIALSKMFLGFFRDICFREDSKIRSWGLVTQNGV